MGSFGFCGLVILLAAATGANAVDRVTATKEINASAGPWVVTASINAEYPYAGGSTAPVVFSAADGFGLRTGDVLTIKYEAGMWCGSTMVTVGTCVDANGYRAGNWTPANDQPGCTGNRYGPSRYIAHESYPVYWMELVGTFADDRGQIVGTPFKVGNGPVNVSVPSGATRVQLGANYCDYTNARNYFTKLSASVSGPVPPVMRMLGTLAHLVYGGPYWKTTIVLANTGTTPAQARLNFFDSQGHAMPLPLASPGTASVVTSTFERTLAAGASVTLVSEDRERAQDQDGWAQLLTDGDLSGFAIFSMRLGDHDQEAVVPLETRSAGAYVLWFDNTGGLVTSMAIANVFAQAAVVPVTIRDESGSVIGTDHIDLDGLGHTGFETWRRLPQTAGRRGTLEFQTPAGGQITLLGLRFNTGAFTTISVLAR